MKYGSGDIDISPKVLYFIEIPNTVGEDEKLELLKHDILIIESDGNIEKLHTLKKRHTKYSAYFYNLENIFIKNRVKRNDFFSFSANIATFIKNFEPNKSLVHTSMIDDEIAYIFRSEGIPYVEKNLRDKKIAYSTILNSIKPFFIENQRLIRSSLRLNLLPMKYKVEIVNLCAKYPEHIMGYIKDLSLSGMGFILRDKHDISSFKLKDRLQVRLFLHRTIIKINVSFVTRVLKNNSEIGVSFNITDGHMIREDYANRLTLLVYNWMKDIVEKHGKIYTSE